MTFQELQNLFLNNFMYSRRYRITMKDGKVYEGIPSLGSMAISEPMILKVFDTSESVKVNFNDIKSCEMI